MSPKSSKTPSDEGINSAFSAQSSCHCRGSLDFPGNVGLLLDHIQQFYAGASLNENHTGNFALSPEFAQQLVRALNTSTISINTRITQIWPCHFLC
jgi:hypothetical protein